MRRLLAIPVWVCALYIALFSFTAKAQERATTSSGEAVILYPDGTWGYEERDRWSNDEHYSGVELIIKNEIRFVLDDGQIVYFGPLRDRNRRYDSLSGRLSRIGNFDVKYDFMSEKVSQIGPYQIKYDFMSGKVEQIGDYRIRYDFTSGKIERIGDTRLRYGFLSGKISEVNGETKGLKVIVY